MCAADPCSAGLISCVALTDACSAGLEDVVSVPGLTSSFCVIRRRGQCFIDAINSFSADQIPAEDLLMKPEEQAAVKDAERLVEEK